MLVYVSAETGNVFVRESPNKHSKNIDIAYNYKYKGIMYETDDEVENSGTRWYHLRGMGYAMAQYFTVFDAGAVPDPEEDPAKKWLMGLNRSQIEQCIEYMRGVLADGGHGNVDTLGNPGSESVGPES